MNDCLFYKILRPIVTGFVKIFFRPNIFGIENIPKEGRCILAGNHTSIFDPLLLMSSTKREIHFLAKNELWQGPKKIIFSNLGLIPVNRKIRDGNALHNAEKVLKNDLVIGIFPEGTTEKTGVMLKFKKGAVKMSSDTDSPIIPFVITGKYNIFKNNLTIKFLDKIYIKDDLVKENERLMNIISKERGN